jgi:hypothetical protein
MYRASADYAHGAPDGQFGIHERWRGSMMKAHENAQRNEVQ